VSTKNYRCWPKFFQTTPPCIVDLEQSKHVEDIVARVVRGVVHHRATPVMRHDRAHRVGTALVRAAR
jgi:hypothetical protein